MMCSLVLRLPLQTLVPGERVASLPFSGFVIPGGVSEAFEYHEDVVSDASSHCKVRDWIPIRCRDIAGES